MHQATLEEVLARFGQGNEQREAQGQSLEWLVPMCKRAGIVSILINGSFVTDRDEPNEVDCVLLQGPEYRARSSASRKLKKGFPFLEVKIVSPRNYVRFRDVLFASDRDMIAKGVVEVLV